MTPRPWYRSRLFWLGLPGLVFLLWGWWLSIGHESSAGFGGSHPAAIAQAGGEVYVFWDSAGWPDWESFDAQHNEVRVVNVAGWKESLAAWRKYFPGARHFFIVYHRVVVAYLAAWLLTLAWWQRRKSRLLKLHTAR